MNVFLKAVIGVLIATVLYLTLSKQDKSIALLLTMAVCSMVVVSAATFWREISDFLWKLEDIGGLNRDYLKIMLKAVGIGIIADITASTCSDAGNASLGKVLQLLATAVILWLSLPLFSELVSLSEKILGEV